MHTVRIETALYDDVELVYQDDSVAGSYLSTPSSRVTFVRTGPQTADRGKNSPGHPTVDRYSRDGRR
ncbi:hypothetical protein HQO44_17565 [Rhodococcus fascians]|nr:hypothetical protein [Rhodococcus fascians]